MITRFWLLFVSAFLLALPGTSFAQNVQRVEEEIKKDKEREIKLQQIIEQRQAEEERIRKESLSEEELDARNLVEVEPNNVLPSDLANVYTLVPYKVRRNEWGHLVSITYSQYNPINYQPDNFADGTFLSDGSAANYENIYGTAPMVEIGYGYKWNFILGSISGEIGVGMFSNDAEATDAGDSTLKLTQIRSGLRYSMDNISFEPYVVPYAFGGVYTMLYDESAGGASYDGTTGVAIYYGAGVMFGLSWLDQASAVEAYTESEIENTFLFTEVRQYGASSEEKDPDFSTDLDINFGLSIEF